jgi:hypothetical protein
LKWLKKDREWEREREINSKDRASGLALGLLLTLGRFWFELKLGVGKRPCRLAGFYKLAFLCGVFIDSGTQKGCNGLVN